MGSAQKFAFYSKYASKPMENFKLRSDMILPDTLIDDCGCWKESGL